MAGTKISNYATGDVNLTALMATTTTQRKGLHRVTLTNMDNTSVPQITAGSVIEIDNSLYEFQALESIAGSAVSGTNYIKLVPSGSSVTAEWTQDEPVFDDDKQGWYSTQSGEDNYRYLEYRINLVGNNYYKIFGLLFSTLFTKLVVRRSSNQVGLDIDPVIFNIEDNDSKNEYNNSTGVFTFKNSGFFHVMTHVTYNDDGGGAGSFVTIKRNGTDWISRTDENTEGQRNFGFYDYFNALETINVRCFTGGATGYVEGSPSLFVSFLNIIQLA